MFEVLMGLITHTLKFLVRKKRTKVVTVLFCGFKTNDDAVVIKKIKLEKQHVEASKSFVNRNGLMGISPSKDMAVAKGLSLAMSIPM